MRHPQSEQPPGVLGDGAAHGLSQAVQILHQEGGGEVDEHIVSDGVARVWVRVGQLQRVHRVQQGVLGLRLEELERCLT